MTAALAITRVFHKSSRRTLRGNVTHTPLNRTILARALRPRRQAGETSDRWLRPVCRTWGAELREVEHGSRTETVLGCRVVVNGSLNAGSERSERSPLRIISGIAFVYAKERRVSVLIDFIGVFARCAENAVSEALVSSGSLIIADDSNRGINT